MRVVPARLTELPGEDLDTPAVSEVASWITIYEELAAVLRSVLNRPADARREDELQSNLDWIEDRLRRWRLRHAELSGIQVDPTLRTVTYAGTTAQLTRRETDLLAYLTAHPDRPFSPKQLAVGAWNNPRLSDAQVRTYMMRLRRKLVALGVGNVIKVMKRRGYQLNPADALPPGGSPFPA
ncbi:MAG TPA: winged helix-turn-helix domain-containing protein [Candidatus Dormibacteraeota bacterium]|nr:winged helix-turn-helix domain-containing protein [Candidatus Dormibacteraeota bacterium]